MGWLEYLGILAVVTIGGFCLGVGYYLEKLVGQETKLSANLVIYGWLVNPVALMWCCAAVWYSGECSGLRFVWKPLLLYSVTIPFNWLGFRVGQVIIHGLFGHLIYAVVNRSNQEYDSK